MKALGSALAGLSVLLVPGLLSAATIYVDDDNAAGPWDGTIEHPWQCIQDGIDAAVSGADTVVVKDGTYTGARNKDLDFGGKAITVQSENGAATTIIDCEGAGRGCYFHQGETTASVADGFTITNGNAQQGGGISCGSNSSPMIAHCTITGNVADNRGGGVCCEDSSPTLTHCTITGNSADYGGGVSCGGTNATITDCTISGNTALGYAGGIWIVGEGSPTITNCRITGNSGDAGGGIWCKADSSIIADCTISANSATNWGGGFGCMASSATITNCAISSNTAGCGGGIYWHDYSTLGITNCRITQNSGGAGGGIGCTGGSATVTNCTVAGNSVTGSGGGIYALSSHATMTNCILWTSTAPPDQGHEIALWDTSTLTVRYSDVQGGAGEARVASGCTLDMDGSCIDEDPLFVSSEGLDCYLSQTAAGQGSDSPCVDAGSDTAANLGLDALTTRTDGVPDGDIVDMGYHAPRFFLITDIYWDQAATSVVVTFSSLAGVEYALETADADAYADGLTWTDLTSVAAVGSSATVTDDLSVSPLTHKFRFYRVRRTDTPELSRQTVGVFELQLSSVPLVKFISTPLIPDPDHASVREVFGEGAARQIARSGFQVSDLNEATGSVSRMRWDVAGNAVVIAGAEFDFEVCTGYEVVMGLGPMAPYKLRLTGCVPEASLWMSLTKTGPQALRWTAYSMPRPILLSQVGLQGAVTPWSSFNSVRLLFPGTTAWVSFRFNGMFWLPYDPMIECGMGIAFIRGGPSDPSDVLELPTWYLHPPND